MEEKRYYFIKASTEYITMNKDLKKLRKAEHGADLVLIYHKLISCSLATSGHIYLEGTLEEFAEDFGIIYGEDPELVIKTIEQGIRIKIIEKDEL